RAGQPRRSDVSGSARRDSKGRGRIRCFVSRFSLCRWTLSRWTRPVAVVVWGSIPTPRCLSTLNRGPRGGTSLLAGDTLQDDQIKCRCVGRVGGWARLGVGFESVFGFVNRLAYYTVLHRAWCSREHCPDGSLPFPRQGVAHQESLDVNDAYRFLHVQSVGRPRVCRLSGSYPALLLRFISRVFSCICCVRLWL